jgi:hypothetical protein
MPAAASSADAVAWFVCCCVVATATPFWLAPVIHEQWLVLPTPQWLQEHVNARIDSRLLATAAEAAAACCIQSALLKAGYALPLCMLCQM